MPTYRIEVSPNNRAGCQDSLCKKEGVKIMKGEIRFGSWVEASAGDGREFQSWRWRHWGCVSGKTIQNIRENLNRDGGDNSEYAWDYMDGLEDLPEDLQSKFRNAIIEGRIADEDWKGDPEYNVLGKVGIRTRASAKKKPAGDEEDGEGAEDAETPTKPPTMKRGRAKKDEGDEDDGDGTPAKKKRVPKVKKGDESEGETKPTKKPGAKKVAKIEEVDGAELFKKEVDDKTDVGPKAHRKPKAQKPTKKAEDSKLVKVDAEGDVKSETTQPARKEPTKKSDDAEYKTGEGNITLQAKEKPTKNSRVKKGAKTEDNIGAAVKAEDSDKADVDMKPAKKPYTKRAIRKVDPAENTSMNKVQEDDKVDVKRTRKSRAKIPVPKEVVVEGGIIKSEKPDDPLEQIAQGFCNEKGPLNIEFNEMVDAGKIDDDDWGGFLEVKFGSMTKAGEFVQGDYHKFLQEMHTREVKALQSQTDSTKKNGKTKKAADTAAARGRKAKAA